MPATVRTSQTEEIAIGKWTFPLYAERQIQLIALWRCEWTRTDFDWLHSMNGDYGERIVFHALVALWRDRPVSTAMLIHARQRPRVALLASVVTNPAFRGRGIAGRLIERALEMANAAGCACCYLGTAARSNNVYLQHGFEFWNGSVMRRDPNDAAARERIDFKPGRHTRCRPADWGDMPDFVHLTVQPSDGLVLDYPRGLISGRAMELRRCVSRFPIVWDDTVSRGGVMSVLADGDTDQVYGFGTLTPGPSPARKHTAVLEVMTHDHYQTGLPTLIEHLLNQDVMRGIETVHAHVAEEDTAKHDSLLESGFTPVARHADAIRLADRSVAVVMLAKQSHAKVNPSTRN